MYLHNILYQTVNYHPEMVAEKLQLFTFAVIQCYVQAEVTSLSGSVIEGIYAEYIVSGLFATDYKYEMFDSMC